MNVRNCRFCDTPLQHSLADLGMSPLSNAYLRADQLDQMEPFYPLHARVCHNCFLVQLPEFEKPEQIFSDYAYFSSYSDSWLEHAKQYTAAMIDRFGFGTQSNVIEVASNDGYLLQYFRDREIPILGIEPAANVAAVARAAGIPTRVEFFTVESARRLRSDGHLADLLIGNNVLAHVSDINDFTAGFKTVLAPGGVLTVEFAHVLCLIQQNEFDTIYHEHFCYLSLLAVEKIFAAHGLTVFDVKEISTHGGSLRVFARHAESNLHPVTDRVATLKAKEIAAGLNRMETYAAFGERVREVKSRLIEFLIEAKRAGKTVVGYGAPAKGNTLLNYCAIRADWLTYTVDRSPHKQGLYLPGTHIPILSPATIRETQPDYVLILPWNLQEEIVQQIAYIRDWGGRFVVPIPSLKILP